MMKRKSSLNQRQGPWAVESGDELGGGRGQDGGGGGEVDRKLELSLLTAETKQSRQRTSRSPYLPTRGKLASVTPSITQSP